MDLVLAPADAIVIGPVTLIIIVLLIILIIGVFGRGRFF